jgi:pyridoxamine 5'-phosphate oxidase
MEIQELLNKLEDILDEAKTAVLATTDSAGQTHMRWMSPVVLKHRGGSIFAFSAPMTPKIEQIEATGQAEWMIQRRDLRQIVNIHGRTSVVDNPALKTELIDILGSRLAVFWHANVGRDEFVVIETVIEQAVFFVPMEGSRQAVQFTHTQTH